MAISKVFIHNNTSVIQDEVLCHRLGLLPIKVDPRKFELRGEEDKATEDNTLVFTLSKECRRIPEGRDNSENLVVDTKVYSGDLVWVPQGEQAVTFPDPPKPVHNDILVAMLAPGQVIDVELHVEKGKGRTHTRWSPVSTATYRLLPSVEIKTPFQGEEAAALVAACPLKVFDIEDVGGTPTATVARSRSCTFCRECQRPPAWKDRVQLDRVEKHYIFSIESTGSLPPTDLFHEALGILRGKATILSDHLEAGL